MRTAIFFSRMIFCAMIAILAVPALAQDAGQADLDKAMQLKISAKTLVDLDNVVKGCEAALDKGLGEQSAALAKQLIASTLYERASLVSRAIFDQGLENPRWPLLRQYAMIDLEKALKFDENSADVYLLIAELQALPQGDSERARKAADKAIELLGDDAIRRAKALVTRAGLQEADEAKLADMDQALQLDPNNVDAWRARGIYYLVAGDVEKAQADFAKMLELDPQNQIAMRAIAEALAGQKKYDEAIEYLNKAIELDDEAIVNYLFRAQVYSQKGDNQKAIEDLNRAIDLEPRNIQALLQRAQLRLEEEEYDLAMGDVDRALEIQPGLVIGLLMRTIILAAQEKYDEAIAETERILQFDPTNIPLRSQLAAYYLASDRPRKAIETLNAVVKEDPKNASALRTLGDAYLAIGQQAEAIEQYEKSLKVDPESSGVLNNLAWVLATSPKDEIRDGKRAVELATKACELTEYEEGHILSTLAAAYAETGDFENARKWSAKAVEIGEEDQLDQLKEELESYKQDKPWRELQETEEKELPKPPKPVEPDVFEI